MTMPPRGESCESCAGALQTSAGESFIAGRNNWHVEIRCTACDLVTLECGRDLPPEPVRQMLLALDGHWVLTTVEAPSMTPVMRALRRVYGGTIAEARGRAEQVASGGLRGTQGELLTLRHELQLLGVRAAVARDAVTQVSYSPDQGG